MFVLQDLDESLRALFARFVPPSEAETVFDPPQPDWPDGIKVPAISCYLHDVTERLDGRTNDLVDIVDGSGRVSARQPSLRVFRCTYLISAWGKKPGDEHRLLGTILRGLIDHDTLPREDRRGELAEEEAQVVFHIAPPDRPAGRHTHDLWSALGVRARSALELVVDVPVSPTALTDIAPPTESMTLSISGWSAPRSSGFPYDRSATGAGGGGADGTAYSDTLDDGSKKRFTTIRLREMHTGEERELGAPAPSTTPPKGGKKR